MVAVPDTAIIHNLTAASQLPKLVEHVCSCNLELTGLAHLDTNEVVVNLQNVITLKDYKIKRDLRLSATNNNTLIWKEHSWTGNEDRSKTCRQRPYLQW